MVFIANGNYCMGQSVIMEGFLNGQEYLEMNDNNKTLYVMGLLDGFLLAPLFFPTDDETSDNLKQLEDTIRGKSNLQFKAIFDKYLNENPELWDVSASLLFWNALANAFNIFFKSLNAN